MVFHKKTSGYWLFFSSDPARPTIATCLICGHEAERPGGNTNRMKTHLKSQHPQEFTIASQTKAQCADRSRQCAMVLAENPGVCASLFSSSSFLDLFPPNERSTFPSRTKLMGHIIPSMVEEIVERNKMRLAGRAVTLVVDSWTSKGGQVCLTAVVGYFTNDNWESEGCLLAAKKTTGRHTANNLARIIKEEIDRYALDVVGLMSDSAANIRAAARELGLFNPRCVSHQLHLVVRKGMKTWAKRAMLTRVKNTARLLNKSNTARESYFKYCEELDLRKVIVPQSVETRWSSDYAMISRAVDQMPAINRLNSELKKERFKAEDVTKLTLLRDVLKKLADITAMVCKEGSVLGESLLAWREIRNHLTEVVEEGESAVKGLAKAMLSEVKKRQAYYFKDLSVLQHTLFDPVKVFALFDEIKWRRVADRLPKSSTATTASYPAAATTAPSPAKKPALTASSVYSSLLKNKKIIGAPTDMDKEIISYLEECRALNSFDVKPLDFWRARAAVYPILSRMSKRYLTVPSTSVSAERIFSLAGILYRSHLRNRLSAERAEELLLLRVNSMPFFRSIAGLTLSLVSESETEVKEDETLSTEKDEAESEDEEEETDPESDGQKDGSEYWEETDGEEEEEVVEESDEGTIASDSD